MNGRSIYMDHIAGTPVASEVLEAMMPFLVEHFGNPASIHHLGEAPQDAIFRARSQTAALIGAEPEEIIFTSGGTEANNLAIKGVAFQRMSQGRHLVVSAIEHYSVLYAAKALERFGFEITLVPVDEHGVVDPDDVKKAMRPDTVLVSIMHANNEVGTIQSLADIASVVHEGGALLHTDAIASVGRIPVHVQELGVDLLSLAANQFNGPKGVGALYCRKGTSLWPLFHGGGQEDGRRTGTENVAGIVGLGAAAERVRGRLTQKMERCARLEKLLRDRIAQTIEEVRFNGHPHRHIPGWVNVSIRYVEGEALLLHMDLRGICVAGASACMSITAKASHVLEAMGLLGDGAFGTLLFTLDEDNTEDEVHQAVETLGAVVSRLRSMSPLYATRAAS
ncbi:cysteine desulfurase family protein [Desulfosoma caldarium]|uniref:cysteine desulfurase n=1 Tax=Desulfosoma caldarium TaxID=610254 RepID=A0A3N1UIT8_9BACT|nr:cysteine desulfurase family protein [Desulfosoma caldarium]ROQ91164.1 cysteine desulfurase [Desulfosoma caldarium]